MTKDEMTALRFDEHVARMWTAAAPGPLTRVRAFGRVSVCPGESDAVEAALNAAGFDVMSTHCTRRGGWSVDERYLDVLSESAIWRS